MRFDEKKREQFGDITDLFSLNIVAIFTDLSGGLEL